MPFGPVDLQAHGIFRLDPAAGQRAGHSVLESQQALAALIAIGVALRHCARFRNDRLDIAHQPHQEIEGVRARVGEAAQGALAAIDGPAEFVVKSPLEDAIVAERGVHPHDLAQVPFRDVLLDEDVLGHGAQMVAGAEEHAGLFHGRGNPVGVGRRGAQRLLDKDVLAGRRRGRGQFGVRGRFREDDHALYRGVAQDFAGRFDRLRGAGGGALAGARRVAIVNALDAYVVAALEDLQEQRGVHVGRAQQRHLDLRRRLRRESRRGKQAGARCAHGRHKLAPIQRTSMGHWRNPTTADLVLSRLTNGLRSWGLGLRSRLQAVIHGPKT